MGFKLLCGDAAVNGDCGMEETTKYCIVDSNKILSLFLGSLQCSSYSLVMGEKPNKK